MSCEEHGAKEFIPAENEVEEEQKEGGDDDKSNLDKESIALPSNEGGLVKGSKLPDMDQDELMQPINPKDDRVEKETIPDETKTNLLK